MAYLNEVDFIKIFVMKPENGMYLYDFLDYLCPVFILVQKNYKFLDMGRDIHIECSKEFI
jgi:hypothetical protein